MAEFSFKKEGASVNGVTIPGDQSTIQPMTIVHADGAAMAGKVVKITTSAPMMCNPVDGQLDATGQFAFAIGPSFGLKGDATIVAKVNGKSKSLDVRFS